MPTGHPIDRLGLFLGRAIGTIIVPTPGAYAVAAIMFVIWLCVT